MIRQFTIACMSAALFASACSEMPTTPSPSPASSAALGAEARPGSGTKPAVGTFACGVGDGICASGPITAALNGNGEFSVSGVQASMVLNFNGQNPGNVGSFDRVDCTLAPLFTCLWSAWDAAADSLAGADGDFVGFNIQNNTLDPSGTTELAGGLLGMSTGATVYKTRFNMTITRPDQSIFWRFDYNPNIPTTGGADLADVVRSAPCTWVFSATGGQRAALSTLVKPPKGKQYTHHEGTYAMPFVLTVDAPNCGG